MAQRLGPASSLRDDVRKVDGLEDGGRGQGEQQRKQEALGAVVVTDNRVEPAAHKAFVAAEMAKLKPVIEAAKQFAD